ncbi:MAG: anthranilate synthase component I family protein [Planctomycetaceae bacterium]
MPVSVLISSLDPALDVLSTLAAFEDERFVLLFDSAARHRERDARYTILTADPVAVTRLDKAVLGDNPFSVLRTWQKHLPALYGKERETLPPFCGGIAGMLSYELGQAFEKIPNPAIDDFKTPALLAGLFDWAIVWDHMAGMVRRYVLRLEDAETPHLTMSQRERVEWIEARLQRKSNPSPQPAASGVSTSPPVEITPLRHRIEPTSEVYSDFTRDQYTTAVARVIEYIRAGDIFQANLSQRLMSPWSGTATQLYASIRTNNPAPFCGLLRTDDFSLVSASPERFLKVNRSRQVETRPIKGTRRRPRSPIADLYASDELSTSEKDRAENVMIVDLLRNDISRSCQPGTVRVTGLCEVERFETVLHLVSTVVGTLRDDCDVWDLMAGCFPGGSITGAPKIRAMEIIVEMEPTVRGAYCGSLFFLGPCGDFDSSILIRTFTLKDGWVHFPVGGGIVADSDPLDEYRETLHKASGMIRSCGRSWLCNNSVRIHQQEMPVSESTPCSRYSHRHLQEEKLTCFPSFARALEHQLHLW